MVAPVPCCTPVPGDEVDPCLGHQRIATGVDGGPVDADRIGDGAENVTGRSQTVEPLSPSSETPTPPGVITGGESSSSTMMNKP